MLLYLLLFTSAQSLHVILCAYFIHETASFTSSLNHHVSPSLLGTSMTTNLITSPSNHTLMFQSFSKLISFAQNMFFSLHYLFSSYLYLLSQKHVETRQGLSSHLVQMVGVLFFYQHTVNFSLIFSNSECHLPLFLSLIPCI